MFVNMSQDAVILAAVDETGGTAASVAALATDTSCVVDTSSFATTTAPTTTSASLKINAVSSKHISRNFIFSTHCNNITFSTVVENHYSKHMILH